MSSSVGSRRSTSAGSKVTVFEVGPRDGLQNESREVSLKLKTGFVRDLVGAGLREIEMGAFVRPDRVPQMADSAALCRAVDVAHPPRGVRYWSLVPNRKGMERALEAGVRNVAVFTAATESFAERNIGMSIEASLREFTEVMKMARAAGRKLEVRGYISTAFGCPFEGRVKPARALRVIEKLLDLGVTQVSVGDTIGVATPRDVEAVLRTAVNRFGGKNLAGHFHDTRGTALVNALRALELGVRTLDSSAGGLGGCPFAPGATGNLATEDLVYLLHGMGFKTGVDLERLCAASLKLSRVIGRPITSRYLAAHVASCAREGARGARQVARSSS